MTISDNGYLFLFTLLGGALGYLAQLVTVKMQISKSEEKEIKATLTDLIGNLHRLKEYWFLVAEYYYLVKYDNLFKRINSRNKQQFSIHGSNEIIENNGDFENYRLLMVEVQTEIRKNLARLYSLEEQLANNIKTDIDQLNINKWPIKEHYININESAVNTGSISRKSVSHYVNQGLNAKGGLLSEIDIVIHKIEENI